MRSGKTKVAILGGGLGGLSAAWALTAPEQGEAFEVTVWQEGWRLGGKAASGRNLARGGAIEERGLHVLMGAHDNAFGILKTAYEAQAEAAAKGEAEPSRFATVWDAVTPEDRFTVMESWQGREIPWVIELPRMPGLPGVGEAPPMWKLVLEMLEGLALHHGKVAGAAGGGRLPAPFALLEALASPALAAGAGLAAGLAEGVRAAAELGHRVGESLPHRPPGAPPGPGALLEEGLRAAVGLGRRFGDPLRGARPDPFASAAGRATAPRPAAAPTDAGPLGAAPRPGGAAFPGPAGLGRLSPLGVLAELAEHGPPRLPFPSPFGHGAAAPIAKPDWWDRLSHGDFHGALSAVAGGVSGAMHLALAFARGVPEALEDHDHEHHVRLADLLDIAWHEIARLWDGPGVDAWVRGLDDETRRALMIADLLRTVLAGALRDGFLIDPAAAAKRHDDIDFRDWLKKHGALEVTREGPLTTLVYDLLLAYPQGDDRLRGDLSAGALVQGLFVLARYRGSFFWKLNAGTGDVIAAPIYHELLRRGVKFEFFARVTDLVPSATMDRLDAIEITRQATVKDGAPYRPLVRVGNLDCWPSTPDYDQLAEGEALKEKGVDLESYWADWTPPGPPEVLHLGEDFEVAILAIPPEASKHFSHRTMLQQAAWRRMTTGVASCQTQSVQLRFDRPLTALGDPKADEMVFGLPRGPLYGSASTDRFIAAERWEGAPPAHETILVGGLAGPRHAPPRTARATPDKALAQVRRDTLAFLEPGGGAELRWPRAFGPGGPARAAADGEEKGGAQKDAAAQAGAGQGGAFDWSLLHAPANDAGPARLDAQVLRANIDPSMRYVQARTGTAKNRLRVDGSGYYNLFFAGDWTDNPGNLGGMEYAIISGRLVSRAISGRPSAIPRVPPSSPYLDMRPAPWAQGAGLPWFIEHNGMLTFPGPFQFNGAKAYAFFVRGDLARMQEVTDGLFNRPSGGQACFAPVSDLMMLSLLEVTKDGDPDRPNISAEAERELAVWMALGRRAAPDSDVITRVMAFCPYLVVDNPIAVHIGRSVYGYAKQPGEVTFPGEPGPDGAPHDGFEVKAWGVRHSPAQDTWAFRRLMRITPEAAGEAQASGPLSGGMSALVAHVSALLRDAPQAPLTPSPEMLARLVANMIQGRLDQLFLKQVRDVIDPQRAILQGFTSAPIYFSNFRDMRLLGPHTVEIEDLNNAALIGQLGLQHRMTGVYGIEMTMDFRLDLGRVVWGPHLGATAWLTGEGER
ncbi:NAD(P)-binding protein [Albimonas sp. CAU 1670]|uniref:NAD(P)-binding protein n=1 Tax=Albimonas sp. CAU 1670 TaxID=3032599 RepID=UPI0023DA9F8F|nr:NAD(P)-binding protein [Albimonas sp. CAU 1670]MDF2235047.1 NAD(P)-binding protein [Albimonas sp. CAU 1670]